MAVDKIQNNQLSTRAVKPYKGLAMEGLIANWYTKIRKKDKEIGPLVSKIGEILPAGSSILEVAPGPGYLAIALARLGRYQIIGLDISTSFVQIAQEKAREAGVTVDFRHGDASDIPFTSGTFDFIICRAAFKNFTRPVQALREMHRVLKTGGRALILDLRRDASPKDIQAEVTAMDLNWINAFMTRWTFKRFLLKNAYTKAEIEAFVSQTDFAGHDVREETISLEIWLEK